jgi:hypothetical protein
MTSILREVPFMGVIRVNELAGRLGFVPGHPDWVNLGQGQPEVGELPGAPPRVAEAPIVIDDNAYGPVEGIIELREAVAAHYNRLYRRGMPSQYTPENVMITPGGRTGLSRCGAALGKISLGHFSPDYTAYEDLLRMFEHVRTHCIDVAVEEDFRIDTKRLDGIVADQQLDALLISNPCNPTGAVIHGDELAAWLELSRRRSCALVMDEYYSHFVYDDQHPGPVSSAAHVEDVDEDRVLIVDGLTKSFRYPGWRIGWIVGPRDLITTMTAVGSFLDGGPSRPMQRAAVHVLEPEAADRESAAVRKAFSEKQAIMIERLEAMGVRVPHKPMGTFYVFGSIADLPSPFDHGEGFMHEGFKQRVLTVPGAFFDVDPHHHRRDGAKWQQFVRFSFGPPRQAMESGLDGLESMLSKVHA